MIHSILKFLAGASFFLGTVVYLCASNIEEKCLVKDERIVFFGDSITAQGARPDGYVTLISRAIAEAYPQQGIQVFGAGVGGNKVSDLMVRLDRDVLRKRPDTVVIYVGINDVWHWTKPHPLTKAPREGTTAEAYEAGLRSLVQRVQASGARAILCTPSVISEVVDPEDPNFIRLEQYAQIVRVVAVETDLQLIDLRKAFVAYLSEHNKQNLERGMLTKDLVHMNQLGNRFIAQQILASLNVPAEVSQLELLQSQLPAFSGSNADLDLYLLIGQSNMAGRARIPAEAMADLAHCYLLNDLNQWEVASNPLNRYASIRKTISMQKLNPGYMFSLKMSAANPERSIGLICNALGGSKIESWEKGGRLYEETIARVKIAQKSGQLKGVLWHQGESNYTDADYLPKLVQLIENLRKDLKDESLPFIAGQINAVPLINDQIAQLPSLVSHTAYVSSGGLVASDKWHFDSESVLLIGERYADALMAMRGQSKVASSAP